MSASPRVSFAPPLVRAQLLRRVNRFVAHVQLDGQMVMAYVPSSGRLSELLLPGNHVLVTPPESSDARRTDCTLVAARHDQGLGDGNVWVCVHTGMANQLAEQLLIGAGLPLCGQEPTVVREAKIGTSRLDFRVDHSGSVTGWVEVKCVTLAEDGIALFPDAPTLRGAKHLHELAHLVEQGYTCAVLFVVQRPDVRAFVPHVERDPIFAQALQAAAQAGVSVHAFRAQMDACGIVLGNPLPVHLA